MNREKMKFKTEDKKHGDEEEVEGVNKEAGMKRWRKGNEGT